MKPAQEVCHRTQSAIPEGGRDVDRFRIFAVRLCRFFGGSLPAAIEVLFRKFGTPQQCSLETVHGLGVIVAVHIFRRNDSCHGLIIVALVCKTNYVIDSKNVVCWSPRAWPRLREVRADSSPISGCRAAGPGRTERLLLDGMETRQMHFGWFIQLLAAAIGYEPETIRSCWTV